MEKNTDTPLKRITYIDAAKWRRTDAEIEDLARNALLGRVMVTNQPDVIESAFMVMNMTFSMTDGAIQKVGAFIGDYAFTIEGMGFNGMPIFLSVGFLHIDDLERFESKLDAMKNAIGIKTDD